MQLTPVKGRGAVATAGLRQGSVGDPLRITTPAGPAVAAESPTATHEPMAVQDTSVNEAEVALTV
jgi:hypothetical protein